MPLTSFSVSSKDFSGQMRPSKPSGMPMTFHPYLIMAALVAARMTALRPGASPPPVPMPIQRMLDIGVVVGRIVVGQIVVDRCLFAIRGRSSNYDHTSAWEYGNLLLGVGLLFSGRFSPMADANDENCDG